MKAISHDEGMEEKRFSFQIGYEPQDGVTRQAPTAERKDICLSRRPQHPNQQNEHQRHLHHYNHPRHVEPSGYRSRLRA